MISGSDTSILVLILGSISETEKKPCMSVIIY